MKKKLDNKLYKFEIIKGREDVAEEWLRFLNDNRETGERLLKEEKAYLEAYFKAVENGVAYLYMFFSAEDVNFSNDKALNHGSDADKKHFEYMKACVDFSKGAVMDCLFYLNNVEDAVE